MTKQKIRDVIEENFLYPLKNMKMAYLPLLMVYFAYGAQAFTGIAETFWVKQNLSLTAEDLVFLGVWLSMPWTVKYIIGQFVDSVPIFGSLRKSYLYFGASLMILGTLLLAGLAGEWEMVIGLGLTKIQVFFISGLLTTLGIVIQDVVADAMSSEIVERDNKSEFEIKRELSIVQSLGRLAISIAGFSVSGLGGWLASTYSFETVTLLSLIIPIISLTGAIFVTLPDIKPSPINWKIMGSGMAFIVIAATIGITQVPFGQEFVFLLTCLVVGFLLYNLLKDIDSNTRTKILLTFAVIFVYRAMPSAGPGIQWWQIDVLGFDPAFFGVLAQIGTGLAILGIWFGSKYIAEKSIVWTFSFLTVIGTLLALPTVGMAYGLHEWTQSEFGFGARTIALIDTAAISPFAQLSMIPMLAMIAFYAPEGKTATWFAVSASFMNLSLTTGSLATKYMNKIFVISREVEHNGTVIPADYSEVGIVLTIVTFISFVLPLTAIWLFLTPSGNKMIGVKS